MNINRDNYEEYFLLYADNELTDYEKAEVLMFVKDNKDLEEEFRMIHYTISNPDANVELSDKSFLFRKDTKPFINEMNYEEIFVLYHDNELSKNEMLETEYFLSSHKQLKEAFDLIGLARLTPENSIVFPNKKNLYKKRKTGKVVPVMLWRVLAAAVFIGFGLWFTTLYLQKPAEVIAPKANLITVKNSSPKAEKAIVQEKKEVDVAAQSSNEAPSPEKEIKHEKERNKNGLSRINSDNDVTASNAIKQKQTKENNFNQVSEKTNDESIVSSLKLKNIPKEKITATEEINPLPDETLSEKTIAQNNIVENNKEEIQPINYAHTASYVQEINDNNENYVFYEVTTQEFKKTKLGGFLKKVKRVVERNNPIGRILSGDDRQVVSN